MKKKLIFTGIVAGVLVFVLALIPVLKSGQAAASDVYGYNATTKTIDLPTKKDKSASDYESTLGNEDNPYVIMELVPYEDMAMMGYLVQGQGAVKESDLASQYVSTSNDAAAIYSRLFESTTNTTNDKFVFGQKTGGSDTVATSDNDTKNIFIDDSSDSVTKNNNNTVRTNNPIEPDYAQYGYFEKVESGGHYDLVEVPISGSAPSYKFVKNSTNSGNYNWVAQGEFNKDTNVAAADKKTTQYVFQRFDDISKVKGINFAETEGAYTYKDKNGTIHYFDSSLGEFKIDPSHPGVHVFSDNMILDRFGNSLTKNNDDVAYSYSNTVPYFDENLKKDYNLTFDNASGCPYYQPYHEKNDIKFKIVRTYTDPSTSTDQLYAAFKGSAADAQEYNWEVTNVTGKSEYYYTVKYQDGQQYQVYISSEGTYEDANGNLIFIDPDTGAPKDNNKNLRNIKKAPRRVMATPSGANNTQSDAGSVKGSGSAATGTSSDASTETGTESKNSTSTENNTSTGNGTGSTGTTTGGEKATGTGSTGNGTGTGTSSTNTVSDPLLNKDTRFNSTTKTVKANINDSQSDTKVFEATEDSKKPSGSSEENTTITEVTPSGSDLTESEDIQIKENTAKKVPRRVPLNNDGEDDTPTVSEVSFYTNEDIEIGTTNNENHPAFRNYTDADSSKNVYNYTWYDSSVNHDNDVFIASDTSVLSGMYSSGSASVGQKYYTFRFDEQYCESYQFVITNNDTLSKKILGRGAYSETNPSGAHIEVIPVTPAILNTVKDDSAKRLIDMADMIVIHDMLDARLMKDSNDYNDDIAPVNVSVNKNVGGNTTSGSITAGDKGYHYFLWKNGYSVNTSGANGSGAVYTKFYGDDAAGLLESAVRNGLVSEAEYNKMTISQADGTVIKASDEYITYEDFKSKFTATRGYFTSNNDISKDIMNEIVKRQASGHPAAMVLDSSAIYKESSTQLKTSSDDKETTTTTTTSNYHDGVPSALTVSFENSPFSSQISCTDYANHSDPNKNTYIHPADKSAAYFHNGNEVWLSYNGGKISFTNNTDTELSLYSCTITVPSYIFFDYPTHKGNQGQCVKEIKNHISGDVNNLEIDFYSLQDNHEGDPNKSGIKGFVTLGAHKTLGPFVLRLECLDTPEYQQMASAVDLNKCPIKFNVIDGSEKVWDSSKYNQDVAEHLNELYIINNYYGAKYFYNVYGVKRDSNGKVVDENTDYIPDYTDPSITGYADDTDAEHSYPKVQTYKYNYTYDQWGNITNTEREEINIDEIRDALVPLTMSHRSYNYLTDAAPANYSPSNDNYSLPTNTHLTQGSYGNGIGKSEFVWDFDGNRSAFSTCFNMSNYSTGTVSNPQTRLGGATAAETANTASNIVKSVSTGLTPAAAITSNAVAPSGAVNTSGAVTTQDYSDKGITRPQYMDSDVALNDDGTQAKDANGNTIPTVDETNLDEVFDQRFAKDANGNILAINNPQDTSGNVVNADGTVVTKNDTNTALLQTSITRADMLAFINKEAQGYNGTTGDKYKTSLKILEVEPTDEFIYGSYYNTEKNDAASNIKNNKYATNLGGISLKKNIDYYSNFDAIKKGFVYAATGRTTIPQQNKDNIRYYFSGGDNQQISINGAADAADYIGYNRQSWKDWKEYFLFHDSGLHRKRDNLK